MRVQHVSRKANALMIAIAIVAIVLFFVVALLSCAVDWVMRTYADPTVDEIIFMLRVPLQGANQEYVTSFMVEAVAPALLCTMLLAFLFAAAMIAARAQARARTGISRWDAVPAVPGAFLAVVLITAAWSAPDIFTKLDIGGYLQAQSEQSSLIEDEYVDPESVELSFPEEKRNLIYIFLESMESTYYSSRNGDFYEAGFIPELEQLALENASFGAGDGLEGRLHGAQSNALICLTS